MGKILVADRIAQEGIDLLHAQLPEAEIDVRTGLKPEQLQEIIGNYTALIVRSETQVTGNILAAAGQLKNVGRAGVGVDNIDIDAAKRKGVMVVKSPTGNIVAAAGQLCDAAYIAYQRPQWYSRVDWFA